MGFLDSISSGLSAISSIGGLFGGGSSGGTVVKDPKETGGTGGGLFGTGIDSGLLSSILGAGTTLAAGHYGREATKDDNAAERAYQLEKDRLAAQYGLLGNKGGGGGNKLLDAIQLMMQGQQNATVGQQNALNSLTAASQNALSRK